MAVEVYYWAGFPGHVAIKVDGGSPAGSAYLSRWPASVWTALGVGLAGQQNSYSDDMTAEGKPPHVVRLTKLNETAMKQAIERLNKIPIYHDFVANCASQVRICLNAGFDGAAFVASWVTGPGLEHPLAVYGYAKALQSRYG